MDLKIVNPRRQIVSDVPTTPHFSFLYGRYHLSRWTIPYLATTMTLREAAKSLQLVSDYPGSDDITWKINELYQRDIDWPRVERQIVPYLRSDEQPQFFNSLTVALLPFGSGSSHLPSSFDNDGRWRRPPLDNGAGFSHRIEVGPIHCGFWEAVHRNGDLDGMTGRVRWNPDQTFAVALDGQHRLAAIKEFVARHGHAHPHLDDTRISVLLVILDSQFGFCSPDIQKKPVDVLRQIFVDLNKHARAPSRARTILLDDRDPTSVCVRTLMGGQVGTSLHELETDPPRLPLSLIDWHTEKAKFEDGPYVTTTLGLDWIIANLLDAKPIGDFTDYSRVRRQIKSLANQLQLDLDPALARLGQLERGVFKPFSYTEDGPDNELMQIEDAFRRRWNPAIVELFTNFEPYKGLLDLRTELGTFSLKFLNWYRLYDRGGRSRTDGRARREYQDFVDRLGNEPEPTNEDQLQHTLRELVTYKEETGSLAFTVAFQRAYFLAFKEVRRILDREELVDLTVSDVPDFPDDGVTSDTVEAPRNSDDADVPTPLDSARQFVEAMNTLTTEIPELLSPRCMFTHEGTEREFWLGTLLRADRRGVDFTLGASARAAALMVCAVAMQMWAKLVTASRPRQDLGVADFFSTSEEHSKMRVWKNIHAYYRDGETSAAARILKARNEEVTEDAGRAEAIHRLQWMWTLLRL